MVVLIAVSILAAAWGFVCYVGHGYANTVDHLSWMLHKHAKGVRSRHRARQAVVNERWVRELETSEVEA